MAVHAVGALMITGLPFGRGPSPGEAVAIGDALPTFIDMSDPPAAPAPMPPPPPPPPPAPSPAAPSPTALAEVDGVSPIPQPSKPEPAPPAITPPPVVVVPAPPIPAPAPAAPTKSVSFGGLSASGVRALSVVYVVDASGPMVTSLPDVLWEVQRSVGGLAPTQQFGVVLFRDDGAGAKVLSLGTTLSDSTDESRARLSEFFGGVEARGRSNPLDGLRVALALRPRVIFLLSRSIARSGGGVWDLGEAATMAELDRLNPRDPTSGRRPVVIKTIQFLDRDPTGIMMRIAQEHGDGEITRDHRVLTGRDLRRN